jgi:hypothetical protein
MEGWIGSEVWADTVVNVIIQRHKIIIDSGRNIARGKIGCYEVADGIGYRKCGVDNRSKGTVSDYKGADRSVRGDFEGC